MSKSSSLGSWVRRFLLEYLVSERNLAVNTQRSYRDTLRLLLPLLGRRARCSVDRLVVDDVTPDRVRLFLKELEEKRSCSVATRNQRLAAIRSLAHFISLHSPEHVAWCGRICDVPFKKGQRTTVTYLEKAEMDAVLAAPDQHTAQGQRDHAVLLFLYNTGARADEAAHALIDDLDLAPGPGRVPSSILIRGKGNKIRRCPIWRETAIALTALTAGRESSGHVFLNRCGRPLTRFGIHTLVERHAARAAVQAPSLRKKQVSPHVIRHTTATHLLRAGVDINTIRAWLGHVSLTTTNVYAEVDLEMKAKALATCEVKKSKAKKPWRCDNGLLGFLRSL
jgi:site-specific recombinase XerD